MKFVRFSWVLKTRLNCSCSVRASYAGPECALGRSVLSILILLYVFKSISQGFRPLATGFGPARLFTAALPSVSDEDDCGTIILEALQINH